VLNGVSLVVVRSVKLVYVSCSPFRVPIARLATAQAVLNMQFLLIAGDGVTSHLPDSASSAQSATLAVLASS